MSGSGKERATLGVACTVALVGVLGLCKWLSFDLAWSAVAVLSCLLVAVGAWKSESKRLRKALSSSQAAPSAVEEHSSVDTDERCAVTDRQA